MKHAQYILSDSGKLLAANTWLQGVRSTFENITCMKICICLVYQLICIPGL